jgi:hypothetical protein
MIGCRQAVSCLIRLCRFLFIVSVSPRRPVFSVDLPAGFPGLSIDALKEVRVLR